VRRLVVLGTAHPRRLRAGIMDPRQRRAFAYALPFQLPRLPERRLTRADDDPVAELMRRWAGPAWTSTADFAEAVGRYRSAARIPQAAYGAMEYYRWAGRSQLRPDGLRYARRMAAPISAPTLQLHGGRDGCILPGTAEGSGRYVAGAYEWRVLPDLGHFLPEEAPDEVTAAVAQWAR
jgi:pimeloyl-ACP methyl ester carboxylesterase